MRGDRPDIYIYSQLFLIFLRNLSAMCLSGEAAPTRTFFLPLPLPCLLPAGEKNESASNAVIGTPWEEAKECRSRECRKMKELIGSKIMLEKVEHT